MNEEDPRQIDWEGLRKLRDLYLAEEPIRDPYWSSPTLLASYDATLGARIGWKWAAVLDELQRRQWKPVTKTLYDFGCGSGVASRTVLAAFPGVFDRVTVFDHSPAAMRFAKEKVEEEFPDVRVRLGSEEDRLEGTVLISHLLTEMPDEAMEELVERLPRANSVLWVEPGTHLCSRILIAIREQLRERFQVSAPCPHQGTCGLMAEDMQSHWCHHFAPTAPGVHQSPFWGAFRRELNLDLASVAYSFLVLDKSPNPPEPLTGLSHLIGRPIQAPKFMRLLSCQEEDVAELVVSRRSGSALYQDVKKGRGPTLFQFERRKNRVVGGERV